MRTSLGQDNKLCYQLRAASKLSSLETPALPSVGLLLMLQFFVYLAFNLFYISFPVYAATGIHWSLAETSVFFSVLGAIMARVWGPVLQHITKIWSDRVLILGGGIVLAVSFVFFCSPSSVTLYIGTTLLALGNGIMWPSLVSVLARVATPNIQGAIQGFASSAAAVASIIGLLAGRLLYSGLGPEVFLISAALTLVTFILAFAIPVTSGNSFKHVNTDLRPEK